MQQLDPTIFDIARPDQKSSLGEESASGHYRRSTSLGFLTTCSPLLAGFYNYWNEKRGNRPMPSRADLDPIDMKRWLPGIIIVDVLENPRRLVYRLVGSRSVALRQADVTGKTVVEAYHGTSLGDVLENYRLVIDEHRVVYDAEQKPSGSGLLKDSETLLLPLSSDGTKVDKVIVYIEVANT
ncbi:PAS domain-containing protein [Dongia rigui]|uniref:PAS domain-containing protein n=1 Tax=Dongia rigui TaxID=940149 RepID=A0ABU5DSW4_9PROT|nr:PAS domain-containing protein [Dongia rigui]MDY0870358.1 PAS domain-containing protein [Dongia rigui]